MSTPHLRPCAAMMLVLHLAGCAHSWRPTNNTPVEVLQESRPARFTLQSGDQVVVQDGEVRGDSIYIEGVKERCRVVAMQRTECTKPLSSVALSDVVQTETFEANSGISALLVMGGVLSLLVVVTLTKVD